MKTLIPPYKKFKGIYYYYNKKNDIWELFDKIDKTGYLFTFNASIYRLDQCIEIILNEIKSIKTLHKSSNQLLNEMIDCNKAIMIATKNMSSKLGIPENLD